MNQKKRLIIGMFLLIGILISLSFVSSAYARYGIQYTQPGTSLGPGGSLAGLEVSKEMCEAGQDFVLQIPNFGCTPAVVRSDLLEEQNVQVFCQVNAIKMNPLIKVEAIDYVHMSGEYPPEVSGVGFFPAKAALGLRPIETESLANNIGYAVINLKRQPSESDLTNCEKTDFGEVCYVEGNLTAKIRYDIQNAFGVGPAFYYLPQISDDEFENRFNSYSFWDGRGFLRAESVQPDKATISIYSGEYKPSLGDYEHRKISTVTLNEGETSNRLFLPNLGMCLANFKIRLDKIEAQDTRARLKINADVAEVAEGEKFLDNRCHVLGGLQKGINKKGIVESVKVHCNTDDGGEDFTLTLNPKLRLSVDDNVSEYKVGDKLYDTLDNKKTIYLGYANTEENSNKKQDLKIYLIALSQHKDNLSQQELESVARIAKAHSIEDPTGIGIVDFLARFGGEIVGGLLDAGKIFEGKVIMDVNYGETKEFRNTNIEIIDFADPINSDIFSNENLNDNYENANQDFDTIITDFLQEKYPAYDNTTLGEKAFYEKLVLANQLGQKRTLVDLCGEFKTEFPESTKDLSFCDDDLKLASSSATSKNIMINNQVKTISFEGIYEPSFEEYGAEILVRYPNGEADELSLRKNQLVYLNYSKNEYVQLIDLSEDSATVRVNIATDNIIETIGKFALSDADKTLKEDLTESFGSSYSFTLTNVNLDKVAKVSVIPRIDYASSEADFSFKIGIEKRAIQLAPDKIKEKIENIDNRVEKWEDISSKLGVWVQGQKKACLATGAVLTVSNLLNNLQGKGIARQKIMRGSEGWYEICNEKVNSGEYPSQEKCLLENSDKIENDVSQLYNLMQNQNSKIEEIQKKYTTTSLGEGFVDTAEFASEYAGEAGSSLDNLGDIVEDPNSNEEIQVSEIKQILTSQGYGEGKYSVQELRDIDLYSKVLQSNADSELKDLAEERLYSVLKDVKVNAGNFAERASWAGTLGAVASQIEFLEVGGNKRELRYTGIIRNGEPIQPVHTSDGKRYIVYLDDSSGTDILPIARNDDGHLLIYDDNNNLILPQNVPEEFNQIYFKKYDTDTYENEFNNPRARYYETEPYKGFPAVVPFDLDDGWYIATKQSVSATALRSYDVSGRANSFYLCNVGENHQEEFFSNIGEDICQGINLGMRETYTQFYGLDESETSLLVNNAVRAIEQAQRQYSDGVKRVQILGQVIEVGEPAADIPDVQCQDFMSPKQCNLIFNVCDPVICPSSRCDLGGAYPVRDVIQSGVIGSALLCLPNAQEGIAVPVCLTGIKAGIDSWLSVEKSYQQCLQENLDSGKTVGICDEVHSVYACDFFWRQALPLTKIAIPKIFSVLTGQNVRGGGEYLGVNDAFEKAEQSVNFFTQYYAENSFNAFKARSTQELVGAEICKQFVSARYPQAELFDKFTEPDSPAQFHGRFDEIPFTSATNPPISHYKVFYHIYAGNDRGAYFRVYLRSSSGSFYQDTSATRVVDSGYIPAGDFASETRDFTAPSGYKEMCINVNGQEECGFKEVSTSFAINYLEDQYLANQAAQKQITTEKECISGTALNPFLLNPNLQSLTEQTINPEIYNQGITRICATDNPGKGTDPYADIENSRWVEVGYCGNEELKCWLDTENVRDIIKTTTIENETVKDVSDNYIDTLINRENYISEENFGEYVENITNTGTAGRKITLINNVLDRVFLNKQKGYLYLLRGKAYATLALNLYEGIKTKEITDVDSIFDELFKDKKFISEEFEVKEPIAKNLFYRYIEFTNGESEWQWSSNKKDWYSVSLAGSVSSEGLELPQPDKFESRMNDPVLISRLAKYENLIEEASDDYNIKEGMIKAIITQESYADKDATDNRGSFGLMQVSEVAAEDVKKYYNDNTHDSLYLQYMNNHFDEEASVKLGTAYFKRLRDYYSNKGNSGDNLNKITLAAYNWGMGNIQNSCDDELWKNCNGIPNVVLQYVSNIMAYEQGFSSQIIDLDDLDLSFTIAEAEGTDVELPMEEFEKFPEKKKEVILSLRDKSYSDGLGVLIDRAMNPKGIKESVPKPVLSTDIVEMNHKGVFGFKIDKYAPYAPIEGLENLYLKYENGEWLWDYTGKRDWKTIQEESITSSIYASELSDFYLNLIRNLREGETGSKGFYEGAVIILSGDKDDILELQGQEQEEIEKQGPPKPERTKWTLESAYNEAQTKSGKYSDNKKFVDELYEDGILNKKEYVNINGEGFLNFQKDMAFLRKLLTEKRNE